MTGTIQDLRYAWRQLGKRPGLTAVAVFMLAVGIGATTAIFSVVYGVLLRPLPYSDPDRITAIFEINHAGGRSHLADPNFDDFRDQNHSFQSIAKYGSDLASVSGGFEPTRSTIASVSPDFFKVFRAQPILGRSFTAADNLKGAAPVVVLSYAYWNEHLGAPRDLSQAHLKINNAVFSVIGVLPREFQFPPDTALWLPADILGENPSRTSHNYHAVARLRGGVTLAQANADISSIARRIRASSSEQDEYLLKDAVVVPLRDSITGGTRPALLILLAAVGFLLLVACANVANLRLAEGSRREREIAVRSAMGAPRSRLVRQFITESFLLSLLGGGLGVMGAVSGLRGLLALAPKDLSRLDSVSINLPIFLFAVLLCSAVAIGLGFFTAVRGTSVNVREGLGESGRGHTDSQASQRLGRSIAAAQIAITLVLVVGAGLLGRSLLKVLQVDPGFRVDKIISMDVSLPWLEDAKAKAGEVAFFANLIDRLKQIPGVRNVGAASELPLRGGLPDGMFLLLSPDEVPRIPAGNLDALSRAFNVLFQRKDRLGDADFCVATSGYFQALGISLLRGRIFEERDGPDSPHVAVISESLARERWPGQDPIGQTIEFGNMDGDLRLLTIVGIVGEVHEYGLDAPPRPTVYVDLFQRPRPAMTITLLSNANTSLVISQAREIVRQLNPEIPPTFQTFSQIYSASLGSRRFNLMLVGFFGIVALSLASVSVFGVMAYSVSRHTREIGVRMALGACRRDVLGMVLSQALRTIAIGVAVGVGASLAVTRALASMLFGLSSADPVTFISVSLLLVVVALIACWVPARRASKVDPMVALRYE
jgi:putative ABC transport system permease protein